MEVIILILLGTAIGALPIFLLMNAFDEKNNLIKRFLFIMGAIFILAIFAVTYEKRHLLLGL